MRFSLAPAFRSVVLLLLLLSIGNAELPPGVIDTQPNGDTPLPPAESLAKITVPDGFSVTLFAGEPDVHQPIAMDFDDRGRLWVVENFSYPDWQSKNQDRILIFEDKDNDGRFDERKVFADGLSNITGIALGYGGVWCCSTPNFIFIPDKDGDDKPDGLAEIKLDGWNDETKDIEHNVFNGMTWGPDGWLYGAHGILADSLVGRQGAIAANRHRMNCGIWRYHPVTGQFDVVAHGTTNPWGIDFNEVGEGFFTNCVIGHLWHLIPGARYERMYGSHFNPFTYTMIDACSDHLHWGGGHWTDSRGGLGIHNVAGGGHAHVGTMIYLGGAWPQEYHGSLFTCNLHGNRINRDTFERKGSGYVAMHGPDFLMAKDPWFRGIAIKYGPDGNVFVSDWTDLGECHDKDGTHRSSGRIYKISYVGSQGPNSDRTHYEQRDLARLPSSELFDLLVKHPNAWQRRHALRLLQERDDATIQLPHEFDTLEVRSKAAQVATDVQRPKLERLRALWATRGDTDGLANLIDDADPHILAWYLRLAGSSLLTQSRDPKTNSALDKLMELAQSSETAANVKLEIASLLRNGALRSSGFGERAWDMAAAMIHGLPDEDDPNLTQMVWYAIEPLHFHSPRRFVELALAKHDSVNSSSLQIARFIVRKSLSVRPNSRRDLDLIVDAAIAAKNSEIRQALLSGIQEALMGVRLANQPRNWSDLYRKLQSQTNDDDLAGQQATQLGSELAVKFRDESVIAHLRREVENTEVEIARREQILRVLVEDLGIKGCGLPLTLIGVNEPRLMPEVYRLIGNSNEPEAERFLKQAAKSLRQLVNPELLARQSSQVQELAPQLRDALVGGLIATPERVHWLLDEIEETNLSSRVILPMHAMQIERLENEPINQRMRKLWGTVRKSSREKQAKFREWKAILTDDYVQSGDVTHGRDLFRDNCGKCHKLFGTGHDIGPDLTGSDRRNLDYVLQNVIDPSSAVGTDYRLQTLILDDGLVATGVIVETTPAAITLQKVDSREIYARDRIEEINSTRLSLMPEGQFDRMKQTDVRDLVAYLRLDQDVPASH